MSRRSIALTLAALLLTAACAQQKPKPATRVRASEASASPTTEPTVSPSPASPSPAGTPVSLRARTPTPSTTAAPTPQPTAGPPAVLVFTLRRGFVHDSVPAALEALKRLESHGLPVVHSEDPGVFTDVGLKRFLAVVFLHTTGDVLNGDQQAAFERYIRAGGGYAGIHSAADTEYDWPWYGGLVGAYFKSHPAIQNAKMIVEKADHPSTSRLPNEWFRTDEWYDFRENPRPKVRVLVTVREDSYQGGTMGADHPVSWCHTYQGGRSWYTSGGHSASAWSEDLFAEHVVGGIRSVARPGFCV
ncbi:MAG TPA: ThuA domain-containing protein [Actinomycetota bacterium]|nr:ThuA domain-containing protein [Actinomycetota bacterium]